MAEEDRERPWWEAWEEANGYRAVAEVLPREGLRFDAGNERRVVRVAAELKAYLGGRGDRPLSLRLDARDAVALLAEIIQGRACSLQADHLATLLGHNLERRADAELVLWRDPKAHAAALEAVGVQSPLAGKSHVSDERLLDDYIEMTKARPERLAEDFGGEEHRHLHYPPPIATDQRPVPVPMDGCAAICALAEWYRFPTPHAARTRLLRIKRDQRTAENGARFSVPAPSRLEAFLKRRSTEGR